MERALSVGALLFAVAALGVALFRDPPAPPPPIERAPTVDTRLRAQQDALERQQSRLDRVEAELADVADRVHELRASAATTGLPFDAGRPRHVVEAEASPRVVELVTVDGGATPALESAVRQVLDAEMQRREQERAARRGGDAVAWVAQMRTRLSLDDAQAVRLAELVEKEQARRAALRERVQGDAPAAFRELREGRGATEEEIRRMLTGEQVKVYDEMSPRERRLPRGPGGG